MGYVVSTIAQSLAWKDINIGVAMPSKRNEYFTDADTLTRFVQRLRRANNFTEKTISLKKGLSFFLFGVKIFGMFN